MKKSIRKRIDDAVARANRAGDDSGPNVSNAINRDHSPEPDNQRKSLPPKPIPATETIESVRSHINHPFPEWTKVAVYLIGQGPYRNPRPIELQHFRIERYRGALTSKLHVHFESGYEDVFIDLNIPRSEYYNRMERCPSFFQLLQLVEEKQYAAVFVDLEDGRAFREREFNWVTAWIERAGAKVLDANLDTYGALLGELARTFDEEAEQVQRQVSDASDFVHFFPGLAARIIETVFRYLPRNENEREAMPKSIDREVTCLKHDNGFHPFGGIYSGLRSYWRDRRERKVKAQQVIRRETELLFNMNPNKRPLLRDESLPGNATQWRSAESLRWAEERLTALGFQKLTRGKIVSYEQDLENGVLYADPRGEGRILVYLFCPSEYQFSTYPNDHRELPIPDTWKHDVEIKIVEWATKQSREMVERPRRGGRKKSGMAREIR